MAASGTAGRGRLWSLLVPLVTAGAGLLFATSASTARGIDLRGAENTDLPAVIAREADSVERSAAGAARLRHEIDELTRALAAGGGEAPRLREAHAQLAPAAGLVPVRGPAVRVELDDAKIAGDALPEGYTVDDIVVHQQDVQGVVNALWAAGAEAMSIQDQRVVATSAVRCVGNTLILQGRVYSPPFVITAIGEPGALRAGLDADATVATYRDYAARIGLGYRVTTMPETTLPAYEGNLDLAHARRAG